MTEHTTLTDVTPALIQMARESSEMPDMEMIFAE